MKLYHVKTQADYDALMQELEKQGCRWGSGVSVPTVHNYFKFYGSDLIIQVTSIGRLGHGTKDLFETVYPNTPITEYTAKEKDMRKDDLIKRVRQLDIHIINKQKVNGGQTTNLDSHTLVSRDEVLELVYNLEPSEIVPEEPEITEEQAWKVIAKERSLSAEEAQETFNGKYRKMLFEGLEQESEIVKRWQDVAEKLKEEIIALREREPEKVIIPQIGADLVEYQLKQIELNGKPKLSIMLSETKNLDFDIIKALDWMKLNFIDYCKAMDVGYEVEKEKLYTVITPRKRVMLVKRDGEVRESHLPKAWFIKDDEASIKLTEQEIKDYDERMWAFAEPVEEDAQ